MAADMSGVVSLNRATSAECQLRNEVLSVKVRHTYLDDINKRLKAPLI